MKDVTRLLMKNKVFIEMGILDFPLKLRAVTDLFFYTTTWRNIILILPEHLCVP